MSYVKSILGKELQDLRYSDIEAFFITSRKESNILEFKSFSSSEPIDNQFNAIYKTICGFLNSDGGLLIWGAPKGQKLLKNKEKDFIGLLQPLEIDIEKDSLINKICSNIVPLPQSFQVEILKDNSNKVCIISIEKNRHGPFQSNNIYYIRLDGQTRPAPHYFIEALFRQIRYPELGGYIKFDSLKVQSPSYVLNFDVIILNHSPLQNDEKISWSLLSSQGLFVELLNGAKIDPEYKHLYSENFPEILHYSDAPATHCKLSLNPYELDKDNKIVHLILTFGGRFSPKKISQYKLDLKNLYPKNIYDIVFEIDENILGFEYGKNKGSEIDKINLILERKSAH